MAKSPSSNRSYHRSFVQSEPLESRLLFAATYTLVDLGVLTSSGGSSSASSISANGLIAGNAQGSDGLQHAFLYDDGTLEDLGTYNASNTYANGVNSSGEVVGYNINQQTEVSQSFYYGGGAYHVVPALGGAENFALGINDSGTVVGNSDIAVNNAATHGFIFSGSIPIDIGTLGGEDSVANAINTGGVAAGDSDLSGGGGDPITYNGTLTDLMITDAEAFSISDSGLVAGQFGVSVNGLNYVHAFLDNAGTVTDLGTLAGETAASIARGVNNNGQVVGSSFVDDGISNSTHAFLDQNNVMVDLNSLIAAPGWTLNNATAVNNDGEIVGSGTSPDGQTHGFLLKPAGDPNNTHAGSITTTTTTATLTPAVVKSTLPTSAIAGFKIHGNVGLTITNSTSDKNSGNDEVELFASSNGLTDSNSTLIGKGKKHATLRPGGSAGLTVHTRQFALAAGTYTILARATDSAGIATDATTSLTIDVAPPVISLAGTIGNLPTKSVSPGKTIAFTVTLTNSGNVDSTGKAIFAIGSETNTSSVAVPVISITKPTLKVKAGGKPSIVRLKVKIPMDTVPGAYVPSILFTQGAQTLTLSDTLAVTIS